MIIFLRLAFADDRLPEDVHGETDLARADFLEHRHRLGPGAPGDELTRHAADAFLTVGPTSHGVRRDMFSPKRNGPASPTSCPLKYSCMCSTTLPEEFSAGSTSTKRRVWTLSASLPIDHSIIRPYQTAGFSASGRIFLASTMAKISSPLASMSDCVNSHTWGASSGGEIRRTAGEQAVERIRTLGNSSPPADC